MRRRPRSPRVLDESWVPPRSSGRSTTLGNLDSPWRAQVDPAGLVTIDGAGWSLDWWVGAEDRWHLPCREVAVRQSLLSASPVVETRLRVPSGDALHRTYAARDQAGREAVVVEIENCSKVPFAVGLAVRPHGLAGPGHIAEVAVEGSSLRVDGQVAIVAARAPGRMALSDAARGDCATVVLDGQAEQVRPAAVSCPDGLAHAALLFPLAHTATLRVVLPLGPLPPDAAPLEPAAFPDGSQVASGWGTHSSGGARMEVPDRRLRDAVAASARHLLLASPRGPGAPAVAAALDLLGYRQEAARRLCADPIELARSSQPGALLHAVVRHWELTRDLDVARASVGLVGALVGRLDRTDEEDRSVGAGALAGAAALLDAVGEPRAALDVRALAADRLAAEAPPPSTSTSALDGLLASAGSTWTWPGAEAAPDLVANAALVTHVRDLLVREEADGLALSPTVPDSWLGQGWELHDAPTRHGRLSFALRWHGERPALLWELEPHDDTPVTLTIPGLDPTWSTSDTRGEALLAPVAVPPSAPRRGLTIPVTIEPMPGRRS